MDNKTKNNELYLRKLSEMKDNIKEAGGLFYQYRPCNIDENTIYDIENILHGVVYARTPLLMNDPFDSEIGFSTEKIYDECIDLCLEKVETQEQFKSVLRVLMKNKLMGRFAELIDALNTLKKELKILLPKDLTQQQKNQVRHHFESAVKKLPKNLQKIISRKDFDAILLIILAIQEINISEHNITNFANLQECLDALVAEIENIKVNIYERNLKKFISTMNISCFSASGWDNPLMWAHYANSYSGICIEYDFTKINVNDFIGFIYPVDYSHQRPTLSVNDLGITAENLQGCATPSDETTFRILEYLTIKDKVWSYEKEWRIIDPQDKTFSPSFINLPYIKSITLGINVNPLIKSWIIEICKNKNIDCYNLKLSYDSFKIDREAIDLVNYIYDFEDDCNFIDNITNKILGLSEKLNQLTVQLKKSIEDKTFNFDLLLKSLSGYEDTVISAYMLKLVVNRLLANNQELLFQYKEAVLALKQEFEVISDARSSYSDFKSQIPVLFMTGLVNAKQKKLLDKKTDDILNITDYYNNISWGI